MSLQTVLGRMFGSVRWGLGAATMLVMGVGGVGVGTAHAQNCDPVEIAKLLADDGARSDQFGNSVSIDGDTAIIGARRDDDNGDNSGSAYIFTRSDGVWFQQAKLLPADEWWGEGTGFGSSVSISGDTVIIGAEGDDENGTFSGSAFVFTRSGGVWTQQAKLLPNDGVTNDLFGRSVSISGDTAFIGAIGNRDNGRFTGSAYVFTRNGGVWTQQAKLLPVGSIEGDRFGNSISLSGNTAVIGAEGHWDADNSVVSGSAYVFTRSGGVWTQQAKLVPSDGMDYDFFGSSVSFDGDTVIVGAMMDNDNTHNNSGSAYVFTRNGNVWTEQIKLLPSGNIDNANFGHTVSLSGDTAVIGAAWSDEIGINSGSAYVFNRSGGGVGMWTLQAQLLASDGGEQDFFARAVSLSGDTAFIGATNNPDSGSVYIFDLGCNDCPADLNGDGVVNTQDFLAFLGAWAANDPLADWNNDGDINTLDFLAYLTDWAAGC